MDVSNQASVDAFLKDPLSVDQKTLDDLFNDVPTEGVAVVNAENEMLAHLEAERETAEAAEARSRGEPAVSPPADAETDESTPPKPDQVAAQEPPAEPADEKASVVLARDGKNVIPFAVLERERETRRALEKMATEQAAQIAALTKQLESGVPEKVAEAATIDPSVLEDLEQNAPTFAAVFKAQQAQIESLKEQLGTVQQTSAAKEQDAVQTTVQEAIDAVPKLLYVQAENVEAYDAIAKIDTQLRESGKFNDLSLAKRFEKAVAMYEAAYGEIALPESASGEKPKPPVVPTPDPAAKAAAAIKAAEEKARPNTLSDIPGGEPPAKDALEDLDKVSAARLTDQFLNMTPDQINKFLARL